MSSKLTNMIISEIKLALLMNLRNTLGVQAKVNALRELQSAGGEELRPFFGRTLLPSVLDRAFKGEL